MEARGYRWLGLIALLLGVGGILALFALRGDGGGRGQSGSQPMRSVTETQELPAGTETAEMPDVVGARYSDAVEQALAAGLFPNSFPVESSQERGTIVDQDPGAGAQVALGATVRIDVSVGDGPEKERQVPDLTGLELPDALRACAEAGFTCRAVPAGGRGRVVTAERPIPRGSTELAQLELSTG